MKMDTDFTASEKEISIVFSRIWTEGYSYFDCLFLLCDNWLKRMKILCSDSLYSWSYFFITGNCEKLQLL